MQEWWTGWVDFYNRDPRLAIGLAGAIVGAIAMLIFSKVVPAIGGTMLNALGALGEKIGGRFAFKSIQDTYLNWVVLENQDLNLTGIIGSDEKPRLEQVFISLKVSQQLQDREKDKVEPKLEQSQAHLQVPVPVKSLQIPKQLRKAIIETSRLILDRISPKPNLPESTIFYPSRIWRLRQVWDQDFLFYILVIVIPMELFPVYGLLIAKDMNNLFTFFGCLFWLAVDWLFIRDLRSEDGVPRPLMAYMLVPHIALAYGLTYRTLSMGQPPFAIGLALVIALGFLIISRVKDGYQTKNRRPKLKALEVDRLLSADCAAVLGKPGCGKSTYIQFMALTFAQDRAGMRNYRRPGVARERFGTRRWFLPIVIPLRKVSRFVAGADPLRNEDLLIEGFRKKVLPSDVSARFSLNFVHHMLAKKQCLFLLDGLDEVADDNEFRCVVNEIRGLVSRYPGNKFVVTSRHAGWRGGLGSCFTRFEVDDLGNDGIANFVESWCQAIEENRARLRSGSNTAYERQFRMQKAAEKAQKLKTALANNASLRRLAENPLLLSIICYVHHQKTLPEERISLYQRCSELLLDQWDREKGLPVDDTNLTPARKEAIIERIAYSLHSGQIGLDNERKEFHADEVTPIVAEMLRQFRMDSDEAPRLFRKLVDRSGIIVSTEQYRNRFAFSHLTFQEYFAAKYLHESKKDIFEEVGGLANGSLEMLTTWWREVLLLYSALQRDPSWIIDRLCCPNDDDLPNRKLQIAAQCVLEAVGLSNHEVENAVMARLLCIRTSRDGSPSAQSLQPQLRQYLLRYAIESNFCSDSLLYLVRQPQQPGKMAGLVLSLTRLVHSVDSELRKAALLALGKLGSKNNIASLLTDEVLLELLAASEPDLQLAVMELAFSVRPDIAQSGHMMQAFFEKALALLPQELDRTLASDYRMFSGVMENILAHGLLKDKNGIRLQLAARIFEALKEGKADLDLVQIAFGTLIKLDDDQEKANHKRQLLEMLARGDGRQQVFAVSLLSRNFGGEDTIVGAILSKLYSPLSLVRNAVLTALDDPDGELRLEGQYLDQAVGILRGGVRITRSLPILVYNDFLEHVLGIGAIRRDPECVQAAQVLVAVDSATARHISVDLSSLYSKVTSSDRWSLLWMMNHKTASKLSKEELAAIISFYEKDRKRHPLILSGHERGRAIAQIGWLSEWYTDDLKERATRLLFEDASNEDIGVSYQALNVLRELKAKVTEGDKYHQLLLGKLSSKAIGLADEAFDLLSLNGFV